MSLIFTERLPRWLALVPSLVLLLLSCDKFPGIDAVGVTRVSSGAGIGVVYVLCPGSLVQAVTLYRAPNEQPDYDPEDVLWQITSSAGSSLSSYVVGLTPSGFVQRVPLTARLAPTQGLALTVDGDIGADVVFTIQDLREHQLFRGGVKGDQYFDPSKFRATHMGQCSQ